MNTDHDAYVEGLQREELLLQRCVACGQVQFFPRRYCTTCQSSELEWVSACGAGIVYSFTVVRRPPTAALAEHAPYVLAIIELSEGPHVMANVIDCDPGGVSIEMPVELGFASWEGEDRRPVFRPVAA